MIQIIHVFGDVVTAQWFSQMVFDIRLLSRFIHHQHVQLLVGVHGMHFVHSEIIILPHVVALRFQHAQQIGARFVNGGNCSTGISRQNGSRSSSSSRHNG